KRIESIKERKPTIIPDLPNSSLKKRDKPLIDYPLNQILYGPPGTGKTYQTIELAYNIASDEDEEEEVSYLQARRWWKNELAKTDDRQLDFITFHQNYSYEDFVMGIKPDLLGAGLVFKEHKGIFFEICQRALANLKQSKADDTVAEPSFESVLEEFLRPLTEEDETIILPMKMPGKTFEITKRNDKNLEFTNASGGTSHQLTFKTIKALYLGNRENDLQGLKSYYDPLVKHLKGIANSKKKVTLKNYVLVIDEINRANISRVFGELITLIEDDKRWGNEHEMEVLLPDNKTKFAIPKNLHIIGTMNTADKSIALLDVALRRRFIFKGIFPNKNEVKEEFREFFETLNEKIVEKKGNDFTIGHAFFHKEKNFDFVEVMNYKVIPLLNEYFYNARSYEVVKNLLNDSLKKIKGSNFEVNQDGFQLVISERN
ncbi:MAG TPA: AAA family ATPase, partial [Emticicia sp.]